MNRTDELPDQPLMDEDAVAEFLSSHPDFFNRHPDLLSSLDVPGEAGDSVSLLERQVSVLRERNRDLRQQLNTLLTNATANEQVYRRMKTLTLALMDAGSVADLDAALDRDLISGFDADHATCFVHGWVPPEDLAHIVGIAVDEASPLPDLFERPEPVCAVHRVEEYTAVFPDALLSAPGSIALVPMRTDASNAVLVIGSWDPQRFAPDMGKVFLVHIGEVMSRTLERLGVG